MNEGTTQNLRRPAAESAVGWKIAAAAVVIFAAGALTGGLLVGKTLGERERPARGRPEAPAVPPSPGHGVPMEGPPVPPPGPPLSELRDRARPELQRRLEERRMEFLLRATRELKLTPEQRARIEEHISESQERIRRLWESVQPQLRQELAEARQRIQEELTPEQRRVFERLLRREPGRRIGEPGPPRGAGPPPPPVGRGRPDP